MNTIYDSTRNLLTDQWRGAIESRDKLRILREQRKRSTSWQNLIELEKQIRILRLQRRYWEVLKPESTYVIRKYVIHQTALRIPIRIFLAGVLVASSVWVLFLK